MYEGRLELTDGSHRGKSLSFGTYSAALLTLNVFCYPFIFTHLVE